MKQALGALVIVICALGGAGSPAVAQDMAAGQTLDEYLEVVRGDLQRKQNSALKTLLQLTRDESKIFWSIKKDYDKERKKIGKAELTLIRDFGASYDNLSTERSTTMAQRFFELQQQRLDLQKRYFDRVAAEINPVIAIQYTQLQRQFEIMGDLKLATHAPLAVR